MTQNNMVGGPVVKPDRKKKATADVEAVKKARSTDGVMINRRSISLETVPCSLCRIYTDTALATVSNYINALPVAPC